LKNKSKFVSLKRILPILSIILLMAVLPAKAQVSRTSPTTEASDKVKIYPNPATAYITFDMQGSYEKGLAIEIYSFLGRKMYETQNVAERTTIDLAQYNRGVYIFHIKDQSGKVLQTGKFQVSK
jgi:hypothetical protein